MIFGGYGCTWLLSLKNMQHGNIQVAMYDDHLEITSPGKLPMGQTLKRLKEGYSQIRNEALAYAFEYMHLIEHWGSGIPRILGKVREVDLREPEFIGGEVDFLISIYRGQINVHSADKINNGSQISITSTDNVDKVPKNEQERLIYKYVLENVRPNSHLITNKISAGVRVNYSLTTLLWY